MFEDTLLESSLRETPVLHRIHYLFSLLTATLFFFLTLHLLPLLLLAAERALFIAAALVGLAAGAYALMLCYVSADSRQQRLRAWPWFALTLLLNLPGFLLYLVYSAQKSGNWKRASIPLAYVAESMLVGVLVLVPLIYTQALPRQLLITDVHVPPPPGPPPAQPVGQRSRPAPRHLRDLSRAPSYIPKGIQRVIEPPAPIDDATQTGPGVIGAPSGGVPGGAANWVIGSLLPGNELPAAPPVHVAPKQQRIRVGGNVIAAQALYQPQPTYPPLAMMARVQGTVVLQAIIGTDGAVKDLKVLNGHPLLVRAAIDAVKTWRYQPTLLNTEPVEVLTEIDVNFTLNQ